MKVSSYEITYTRPCLSSDQWHSPYNMLKVLSVQCTPFITWSTHIYDLETHPSVQWEWPLVVIYASLCDHQCPILMSQSRLGTDLRTVQCHKSVPSRDCDIKMGQSRLGTDLRTVQCHKTLTGNVSPLAPSQTLSNYPMGLYLVFDYE